MNSAPSPDMKNSNLIEITDSEGKAYTLTFSIKSEKLEISISNNSLIFSSFKASFTVDELYKLNKFFRQFDSVEEIYDFIINLEKIEEKINFKIEDKFINLKLSIPNVSKTKTKTEINFMIPSVEIKESDLIIKLCEKVEKIDILEKKINYLFFCSGKTEKDYNMYEKFFNKNIKIQNFESKIITLDDFTTVSIGVKEKLNKRIKEIKLLYRATRDGDSSQFHSKCDGKENTVTFVKAKTGRKFGGFANQPFHSKNAWIQDPNCFVFSLFHKECYYHYQNNYIYGSSSFGPLWGGGNDLYIASGCLNNTTSTTVQSNSFDYRGRSNALSGETKFQAEDVETYELILE